MRAALLIAAVLVAVTAVVLRFVLVFEPHPDPPSFPLHSRELKDAAEAEQRFSGLLQFKTVSCSSCPDHLQDEEAFKGALAYMKREWPVVWANMETHTVNKWSILVEWKGSDPSLLPVLFVTHYDVVPVAPETLDAWKHPPFSGTIDNGLIYGRGAIDLKFTVSALLEAFSQLYVAGHRPRRTMFLTIGHDEEVGGDLGAKRAAQWLEGRGIQLQYILDEGTLIFTDGLPPFVQLPLALISTAEKGYTRLRLNVSAAGGHGSMPPVDGSAVPTIMARIVQAVEQRPPPACIRAPVSDLLRHVARLAPRPIRGLLYNSQLWPVNRLLGTLMARQSSSTSALVRMTVATTGFQAEFLENNVLPQAGSMILDVRTPPEEGSAFALGYIRQRLGRDAERVEMEVLLSHEPSEVSPSSGPVWDVLYQAAQETLRTNELEVMPVAPLQMVAGTDSKHFRHLAAGGTFRFLPMRMNRTAGELSMVHGANERAPLDSWRRAVLFYMRLVELSD